MTKLYVTELKEKNKFKIKEGHIYNKNKGEDRYYSPI